MSVAVAEKIAAFAQTVDGYVEVIWHGGEPLSTGLDHFRALLGPFMQPRVRRRVRHVIQTNATLLNDAWCSLLKTHRVGIGVSIDGTEIMNKRRLYVSGRTSHQAVMKGIDYLNAHALAFSIIAVVGEDGLASASDLYAFAQSTGCQGLGVNIEEQEGINTCGVEGSNRVVEFWKELYHVWRNDPTIRLREFDTVLRRMQRITMQEDGESPNDAGAWPRIELFPSITVNGDVSLLSPELMDAPSNDRYDFVIGNVLETSLSELLRTGREAVYVQDHLDGIQNCRNTCEYFRFCGGGAASNKFYEHGDIRATETEFCRTTRKALVDAVLASLEETQ